MENSRSSLTTPVDYFLVIFSAVIDDRIGRHWHILKGGKWTALKGGMDWPLNSSRFENISSATMSTTCVCLEVHQLQLG